MPKDILVSLVIPVRNETATVADLLTSIHSQTVPANEVLFVDGGSLDNTVEILRGAAERDSSLHILEAQDATPGRGRNIGIEAASNDWIALTDAGICLESTWLERLIEGVEQNPSANLVFGAYEARADTFFQQCAAAAYVAPKQLRPVGPHERPVYRVVFAPSQLMACSRRISRSPSRRGLDLHGAVPAGWQNCLGTAGAGEMATPAHTRSDL